MENGENENMTKQMLCDPVSLALVIINAKRLDGKKQGTFGWSKSSGSV
jgi:hypothetical protein